MFGKSRSGKTELSAWLFRQMRNERRAIINPKNDRKLAEVYPNRQYRPPYKYQKGVVNIVLPPSVQHFKDYDKYLMPLYLQGNTSILWDEASMMCSESSWPSVMQMCVRQGMGRGIGNVFLSQRAVNLAGFIRSESTHIMAFRLQNANDRAALEKDTGVSWSITRDLPKYHFAYYGPGFEEPVLMEPIKIL